MSLPQRSREALPRIWGASASLGWGSWSWEELWPSPLLQVRSVNCAREVFALSRLLFHRNGGSRISGPLGRSAVLGTCLAWVPPKRLLDGGGVYLVSQQNGCRGDRTRDKNLFYQNGYLLFPFCSYSRSLTHGELFLTFADPDAFGISRRTA